MILPNVFRRQFRKKRIFVSFKSAAQPSLLLICRTMSANVISQSSSSSSPSMSSTTCGKFLPVEFTIFFFIFLTGLTSNVIFILLSFRKLVNAKGCSVQKYNIYLVHWSIANLILLVFNMPFDVITYSTSGAWFFGEAFCRLGKFQFYRGCVHLALLWKYSRFPDLETPRETKTVDREIGSSRCRG